jgi:hypothetical protein
MNFSNCSTLSFFFDLSVNLRMTTSRVLVVKPAEMNGDSFMRLTGFAKI